MQITFDASSRDFIINAFDKAVDKDGYLVEKSDPNSRVLDPDGEEVEADNFAGVRRGSEVYVKSDIVSLIKLCDDLREQSEHGLS